MEKLNLFLSRYLNNITVNEIFKGVVSFLISVAILKFLELLLLKKINRFVQKTKTKLDDLTVYLIKRSMPFFYIFAIYIGIYQIHFAERTQTAIAVSLKVLLSVYIVFLLIVTLNWFVDSYLSSEESKLKKRSLKGILVVAKLLIYTFGLVLILDNLGVDITALITGLGISGIAVALAVQKILEDLFNYFAIVFDKPFEEGDFIVVNNLAGTIEHIGVKSTRIRSLSGEEVIVSNTNLIDEYIQNYKRMKRRRVVFKIGVIYETPISKLKKIPSIVKQIIDSIDGATFDRCHFSSFGDFSLNFETVYYVEDSDYLHYMNINQEVNLKLMKAFESEGIEFAYPTQVVYIEGGNKRDE